MPVPTVLMPLSSYKSTSNSELEETLSFGLKFLLFKYNSISGGSFSTSGELPDPPMLNFVVDPFPSSVSFDV